MDGWAGANAPLLDGIQIGDNPKALIHTIAEDMLQRFAEAPLIDQYEAYQRLMSYWSGVMQDDVFIIAHDGWGAAKELREARKEVDKDKKVKWLEDADLTVNKVRLVADVIKPALIVARFFPELRQALDDAQAKAEELGREIEELVEEHGAEGGLLADAMTDAGKLTAASVKSRTKSGEAEPEEMNLLKLAAELMTAEAAAKKAAKDAEDALIASTLKKYPTLTEDEMRALVVDDKWLTDIAELIEAEIEARTEQLTARVRVLTERYGYTLMEITGNLKKLENKVSLHLSAMGFSA